MLAGVSPLLAKDKDKDDPIPPLPDQDYWHPSGAFHMTIPGGWTAEAVKGRPEALDLSGDGFFVRLIYRSGENGYDALHGICLMERLQDDADIDLRYEYDYEEASYGTRRSLDSAFTVQYEKPIQGHKKWRQRNLTIVGGGQSLCLVANAPASVWKNSRKARSLLKGVLESVKFLE
jgi:hypothetical protein